MNLPITLRVDVTEEDIRKGLVTDCIDCPVALAATRAGRAAGIPHHSGYVEYAYVFYGHIQVGAFKGATPDVATGFMNAFDGGKKVEPLSFDLTLDTHV